MSQSLTPPPPSTFSIQFEMKVKGVVSVLMFIRDDLNRNRNRDDLRKNRNDLKWRRGITSKKNYEVILQGINFIDHQTVGRVMEIN